MASNNFPRCIYLDTNIIRRVGLTDPGPSFLELKEWADKSKTPIIMARLVWLEWLNDFNESIRKKVSQTKSNLRDLKILLGIQSENYELPKDYLEKLVATLNVKLKTMNISITNTPKNINLDELVTMAAFKIRPFEERNEKGFRDTIILYTILEDMRDRKVRDGIFITDDVVFTHEDVLKIVKKYKVNLEVVSSLEETSLHIKNILDNHVKNFIEKKKQKLIEFVKSRKDEIFTFIKENAELTEDFITKGGFLSTKQDVFGQIERVLKFEPFDIDHAFETGSISRKRSLPDNIEPILISVKTHLIIEYLPLLVFNRPGVKVQDLNRFKEVIQGTVPRYYGDLTELELVRDLTVAALVVKDDKDEYSELRLEDVNTF